MKNVKVFNGQGEGLYAEYSALKFPGQTVIAFISPEYPMRSDFPNDPESLCYDEAMGIYDAAQAIFKKILPNDVDNFSPPEVAFIAGTEEEIWEVSNKLDACYDGRERIPWWIYQDGKCVHEYS